MRILFHECGESSFWTIIKNFSQLSGPSNHIHRMSSTLSLPTTDPNQLRRTNAKMSFLYLFGWCKLVYKRQQIHNHKPETGR